ncbi:MAG: hypothetical protein LBP55_08740 [Candidatus Adiutrix sp.]|jgi:hypothetical protein|nr:hypothetical protein [Candidatus Adiutrix sp.]
MRTNSDHSALALDEDDWLHFNHLTSLALNDEERRLAGRPDRLAPQAEEYLAVHWHPEWAPLDLIRQRLDLAFPRATNYLAIPTQHNRVLSFGPWAGVEADAYDRAYNMKVQLLIHFPAARLPKATAFLAMMDRTYNYRAHQLLDILARLAEPDDRAAQTQLALRHSVTEPAVQLARANALRLKTLIDRSGLIGSGRDEMLKNRLLPDFILARTGPSPSPLVEQALIYITAIQKTVKADLSPQEFYTPQEVIEEARSLGGGVVIPHPPQFWPILLSGLDIDGWEVWNPSTPRHTLFLLEALARFNDARRGRRQLLAFMGDDTHMSAKFRLKPGADQNTGRREIGFQEPWTDPAISALLDQTGQSLTRTINEYRQRLA